MQKGKQNLIKVGIVSAQYYIIYMHICSLKGDAVVS